MRDVINIPVTVESDEKGYYDRECPKCQYSFKVKLCDWEEKVSYDEVHCPMCGHVDASDKWFTQEQLDSITQIVQSAGLQIVQDAFRELERSTRHNKYIKFKTGKRISFVNTPIGQSEEWETEIVCPNCGMGYSVRGAAFFCPNCGYNSATDTYKETLNSIKKMIDSLPKIKQLLEIQEGKDSAIDIGRSMLESTVDSTVAAFQKVAACIYKEKTNKESRQSAFQSIKTGNDLFVDSFNRGYSDWLSQTELSLMNRFFNMRHIIEHNGGIVDQNYINRSGDTNYAVGQRIVVKENEVKKFIDITEKLVNGLIEL